jgi:hypothetical protein
MCIILMLYLLAPKKYTGIMQIREFMWKSSLEKCLILVNLPNVYKRYSVSRFVSILNETEIVKIYEHF